MSMHDDARNNVVKMETLRWGDIYDYDLPTPGARLLC